MLLIIIVLLIVGLLLFVLEAFLPGGIVGVIGAIAIVASAVLCFTHFGPVTGTLYLAVSLALSVTVGLCSFLFIAKRLALTPPEPAQPSGEGEKSLVGATGRVTKTLNPTGNVEINGRRHMARAESSLEAISKGEAVAVIGIDSTYLVVVPADSGSDSGD